MRFICETASAHAQRDARRILPLAMRISCTDWTDGGWTIDDSVALSKQFKEIGVDLDRLLHPAETSRSAKIPVGPGYQVPFAEQIRKEANIATAAVGLITEAKQADEIIRNGQGRHGRSSRARSLRDPYFPIHAAARTWAIAKICPCRSNIGRALLETAECTDRRRSHEEVFVL